MHRCQSSYLLKWDRSVEKEGHLAQKAGIFSLATLVILSHLILYIYVSRESAITTQVWRKNVIYISYILVVSPLK